MLIEFLAAGVAALNISAAQPYQPPQPEPVEVTTEAETEVETEPEMELLGTWTVTEYCTKCNSGSARQTASGKRAEEWWTCAVSKANYKKYKGCRVCVEGYGEFEIQDWGSVHGCDKNKWIDLFLPASKHNRVYDEVKVYLIQG
ncbi:MAG: hypothetical protein IKR26_04390 [Lachnospiraceae bacterium]|nr:hypothetical protein [Lachnospiraceae bacterium]